MPGNQGLVKMRDDSPTTGFSTPIQDVSIIHLVLGMFALYLAWRCNSTTSYVHLVGALCCPYIYIPYALAVTCRDTVIFPRLFQ